MQLPGALLRLWLLSAWCAGPSSAKTARLPPGCVCENISEPVCGSDGLTYGNPCHLECVAERAGAVGAELTCAYYGPCTPQDKQQSEAGDYYCHDDGKPVCGTDGVTYPTHCDLANARARGTSSVGKDLRMAFEGDCSRIVFPTEDPSPEVNITDYDSCICEKSLFYVCGTDGVTYPNACVLGCISDIRRRKIEVAYNGEC